MTRYTDIMRQLTSLLLLLLLLLAASVAAAQTPQQGAMLGLPNAFTSSNSFAEGVLLGPYTVSQLSTVTGITNLIVVSDGTPGSSPCTGSGTGALASYYNGQWNCGVGGGGDSISSPNSTLTVGGSSTATTLDLNLANPNTWTGTQTFGTITPTTIAGAPNFSAGFRIEGSTIITSASSANSQAVTCPTGGTGTQVCDASGAWIASGGGSGTVTSITAGTGLTGGTITTSGTIALSTPVSAGNGGTGISNTATLTLGTANQNWATLGTGIVKNTTTTGAISDAASADVIALWSGTCNSSTFLNGAGACATSSGGTVTSFSAGNLSPLFTTSVATATTTPALTFALSNAAAGTVFGNATGSSAAPSFSTSEVLGATGQASTSTLTLYGSTASSNLAPPYISMCAESGTPCVWLYPSTTFTAGLGINSSAPTTDIATPHMLLTPGGIGPVYLTGTSSTTGLLQCPVSGTSSEVTDCGSNATIFYGIAEGTGNSNTRVKSYGVVTVNIPSSTTNNGDYICSGTLSAATYNAVDNGSTKCSAGQQIGFAITKNTGTVTSVQVQLTSAGGISGGGVTSISGDGTIITNSASTGAVTLTIAGTSGGVPYFSSTSGWASSALLPSGDFVLGGGAGSAPTATFSVVPLNKMTQVPFDSQANDLTTPTGNGSFTYPTSTTANFTLTGTAPTSSSSAGTAEGNIATLTAGAGGATTGSATTGGAGGGFSVTGGAGGSGSGGTNASGGAGGGFSFIPGLGGTASGSGTAGVNGGVTFGLPSYTAAITNSPLITVAGSYESVSTPTYAEDSWTMQDKIGTGVNGTSQLTIAHSGTTGSLGFVVTAPLVSLASGQSFTGATSGGSIVAATSSTGGYFVFGTTDVAYVDYGMSVTGRYTFSNGSTAVIPGNGYGITSSGVGGSIDTILCRSAAGVWEFGTSACNASGSFIGSGGALGAPTGGNEGAGTINVATGYYANGTAGITSTGVLCTATFASVDGLTTACTAVSDPRLKDYVPAKRGLVDILQLHPIDFTYNSLARSLYSDLPTELQTGFNAENVQDVMPEAVSYDDKGFLQLPQGDRPVVAATVVAIQQMQAEIDQLKAEIVTLKKGQ
jgi:hypothetical protein